MRHPRELPSRLFGALWLLALIAYVFAGMALAPFHGDEAMHIYSSRDFAAVFLRGDPASLLASPPYISDSDPHLRLINGSVNRFTIGLAWWLAGMSESDLPAGVWSWAEDLDANRAKGNLPSDQLLIVSRFPSTIFLALSVAVVFALARLLAGQGGGLAASAIYALHPVILLNGRRAMQEGALLFFGLLAVLIAARLARRLAQRRPVGWRWWMSLSIANGFALASKHSGLIFVAASFGWILAGAIIYALPRRAGCAANKGFQTRLLLATVLTMFLCGVATLMLFVALSPALWSNPIARFQDLLAVRRELLAGQVAVNPGGAATLAQRVETIVTQPFLSPPQYFEAAFWADFPPIRDQIERYDASLLGGLRYDEHIGIALTLFAAIGLAVPFVYRASAAPFSHSVGLVIWLGLACASLLLNPLPWQRYAFPLIPIASLLASVGIVHATRWLLARVAQAMTPGANWP